MFYSNGRPYLIKLLASWKEDIPTLSLSQLNWSSKIQNVVHSSNASTLLIWWNPSGEMQREMVQRKFNKIHCSLSRLHVAGLSLLSPLKSFIVLQNIQIKFYRFSRAGADLSRKIVYTKPYASKYCFILMNFSNFVCELRSSTVKIEGTCYITTNSREKKKIKK